MRVNLVVLILLVFIFTTIYADYSGSIITQQADLSFGTEKSYDFINIENVFTDSIGAPQLPVKIRRFLIPHDVNVSNVFINSSTSEQVQGSYYIFPVQHPQRLDGNPPPPFIEPDSTIYNSSTLYPGKLVEIVEDGYICGYHVVTLKFFPVEYIPDSRTVLLYNQIDFTIEYETNSQPISLPARQSVRRHNIAKSFIQSIVENPTDFDVVSGGAQEIIPENNQTEPLNLNFIPTLQGNIVDYIIITNDELKPVFQEFADWKIKKGVPTLVVTTAQIESYYNGCDLAEKIRNYLKDAKDNWGDNLYVLLGGDTEIIPARIATYYGNDEWVTDLYYATYDGNWNSNGDHKFGDGADLLYDYFTGRASVENITEAQTFVNKAIDYEKQTNAYVNNLLLVGAYYDYWNTPAPGGYDWGQRIHDVLYNQYLNNLGYLNLRRLYDDYQAPGGYLNNYPGDKELNRNSMLNHLNNGYSFGKYHIISHFDHGSPYCIGTSSRMKGDHINRSDMDQLVNGIFSQILFTTSCDPFDFPKNCFAEHYVNNQNNGGVAFFGNTGHGISWWPGYDWQNQHKAFVNSIYYLIDGFRLGFILEQVRANSTYGSVAKKNMNLLGDPEMPVWTDTPQNLIVSHPSSVTNGAVQFDVTINNLSLDEETVVCLKKDDEDYAYQTVTGTGSPVTASFYFTPDTPGDLDVTVTAHNYIPYEQTVPVTLTNYAHLYIEDYTIDDDNNGASNGNGDGKIDAGETIEMSITVRNGGDATAQTVNGILSSNSSSITFSVDAQNFGDIPAGQSATSQGNYVFTVSPDAEDGEYLEFQMDMTDAESSSYQDDFYYQIYAPAITQTKTVIMDGGNGIQQGEEVGLFIDISNYGSGEAVGITAALTSNSSFTIDISDGTKNYGNIISMETITNSDDYNFIVTDPNYTTGDQIDLKLTVQNYYGKTREYDFNLNKPQAPQNLTFNNSNTFIDVIWDPVSIDVKGYNIYRSDGENGPYDKINQFLIEGTSYYKDENLPEEAVFYYRVKCISPGGVESEFSNFLQAWTSLPQLPGWPIVHDHSPDQIFGTPAAYDINGNSEKEIFLVDRSGVLLGFYQDGDELFDIDNNPTTISGFATYNSDPHCTPALGDIDNDGITDIVVSTRDFGSDARKVFAYKTVDNNGDNKPDPLWPQPRDLSAPTLRGAVLSDLNNDGFMEIIIPVQNGNYFYVLDHSGDDFPGWPKTGIATGTNYGMPVAVDLDGDDYKEIIMGFTSGLYIWRYDGSDFSTNPILQPGQDERFVAPPTVVDLDNDGDYEIFVISTFQEGSTIAKIRAIHHDGSFVANWTNPDMHTIPLESHQWSVHNPPTIAVGDLDLDSDLEVVVAGYEVIKIWDHQGNDVRTIPVPNLNVKDQAPVLADVDEDPEIEIVITGDYVYGYNPDGT